jgi:hypothetical protein
LKRTIGNFIKKLSYISYFIFGFWGLFLDFEIVIKAAGFLGGVIGFFILPVTFLAAPFYAGIAWGDWFPLIICYGGWTLGTVFFFVGCTLNSDKT